MKLWATTLVAVAALAMTGLQSTEAGHHRGGCGGYGGGYSNCGYGGGYSSCGYGGGGGYYGGGWGGGWGGYSGCSTYSTGYCGSGYGYSPGYSSWGGGCGVNGSPYHQGYVGGDGYVIQSQPSTIVSNGTAGQAAVVSDDGSRISTRFVSNTSDSDLRWY